MSAASVLQSFSASAMPGPVMPMDVAMPMRFYLSHSPPPLRGILSYKERPRTPPKLRLGPEQTPLHTPLRPCLRSHKAHEKKHVVFADMKGMSLTAIHVFSNFDDNDFSQRKDELQFDMADLKAAVLEFKSSYRPPLQLDFQQPCKDYLDFRNRLLQNSVCLENCTLAERTLSGIVKVRNVGFEKSVQVRITYDSWASFQDVECQYISSVYVCSDSDHFSFTLEIPSSVQPRHSIEFCVCYTTQGQSFWDNNKGKNYRITHTGLSGGEEQSPASVAIPSAEGESAKLHSVEYEQFGSPRLSSGMFPGWQSWGQVQSSVPYW